MKKNIISQEVEAGMAGSSSYTKPPFYKRKV